MRILSLAAAAMLLFFASAASAQVTIEPNPARGVRQQICHEFERGRLFCNTVSPNASRDTCPVIDGRLRCPEEDPNYRIENGRYRVAEVSCGEDLFRCRDAFFIREGQGDCVSRVIRDYEVPRGSYEVRLSDLPNEHRITLIRSDNGHYARHARIFARQRSDLVQAERLGAASLVPLCYN